MPSKLVVTTRRGGSDRGDAAGSVRIGGSARDAAPGGVFPAATVGRVLPEAAG